MSDLKTLLFDLYNYIQNFCLENDLKVLKHNYCNEFPVCNELKAHKDLLEKFCKKLEEYWNSSDCCSYHLSFELTHDNNILLSVKDYDEGPNWGFEFEEIWNDEDEEEEL